MTGTQNKAEKPDQAEATQNIMMFSRAGRTTKNMYRVFQDQDKTHSKASLERTTPDAFDVALIEEEVEASHDHGGGTEA